MPSLRCFRRNSSPQPILFTVNKNSDLFKNRSQRAIAMVAIAMLIAIPCFGLDEAKSSNAPDVQANSAQTQDQPQNQNQNQTQAAINAVPITIPAGTMISLVLTHSIQSRHVHRGDPIYAQITFPVNSGNAVAIPAGTFVQGVVDRLDQNHGRAELHLQSISITFPDGYVAPIPGPITLEAGEGYSLKDPGPRGGGIMLAMIGGGAGVGALIGHSAGASSSTQTITNPPGCTVGFPDCLSSSMPVPGTKGRDTAIGVTVGAAAGGLAGFAMLASSRHFFVDVGTPVDLTLRQPITLQGNEVAAAVQQSAQQGVSMQPVFPRPAPPPLPDTGPIFPTNPGTPPTIIPGPPGPGGVPGPPIIIPGTPPGV